MYIVNFHHFHPEHTDKFEQSRRSSLLCPNLLCPRKYRVSSNDDSVFVETQPERILKISDARFASETCEASSRNTVLTLWIYLDTDGTVSSGMVELMVLF